MRTAMNLNKLERRLRKLEQKKAQKQKPKLEIMGIVWKGKFGSTRPGRETTSGRGPQIRTAHKDRVPEA